MNKRAVMLLSGGLDSTLAAKMMLEQGIELEAINFVTTFCTCTKKGCQHQASKVAKELGIKITVKNITQEYLDVVRNPRFGYGSGVNPCIDCRVFTFRKAKEFMEKTGASFIVTGEVMGERPMSQRRDAMMIIERESALKGLIVRPLSAKLFDPTIPEEAGLVDREKLLAISGRSRKPQMELAEKLNITEYPCPAGGCLLTDPQFSERAKDLLAHNEFLLDNILLLKAGRHFRWSKSCKLVVGRNENENEIIFGLSNKKDILMNAKDLPGPLALLRGEVTAEDVSLALRITARYVDRTKTDDGKEKSVFMEYWDAESENKSLIEAHPLSDQEITDKRI
ncbi:MAG: 7-cyano-7-deazaguanine synthase [Candidatus Omnitrophica bacterium]|nr:7-cyano-7-deazaguanine synthase [Candidatus Omnitrophota bacterium]